MHVHLPEPLHGWREFAGEVGIIVLGVLIALSAEQLVHGIREAADEKSFVSTIDHEIGLNLFAYHLRAEQFSCEAKRVDELRNWLVDARSGDKVPPLRAVPLLGITPYRSAWDNRNAEVFNALPAKRREKYAEFYDEINSNSSLMRAELEDWKKLRPYAEGGAITLADRRVIRPLVAAISDENATLQMNLPVSRDIAEVLKVKEVEPDGLPKDLQQRARECRSVIPSIAEAAEMNRTR